MPNLAVTYFSAEGPKIDDPKKLINDMPIYIENWLGAGGMYSTVEDLLVFAHALYGGKLISKESLGKMLTPGLDDYGFGLWIRHVTYGQKSYQIMHRPGGIMGANGSFAHYQGIGFDDQLNIMMLSNTDATDQDAFYHDIAKFLLTTP